MVTNMFILILFNNLYPILPVLLAYGSLEITQMCVEGYFKGWFGVGYLGGGPKYKT